MSFVVRMGESEGNDRRLAVVRKKYFHGILEFNQQSQREKRQQTAIEKQETNQKYTQMHQSALEQLQEEVAMRHQQKIMQQEALREEYQRQIHDRRQRLLQERERDKKYARLQLIQTDRASERRVADLLKIYDRATVRATHRRVRTEAEETNPESNRQKKAQQQPQQPKTPFLPSLQRVHATSVIKNRPQPQKDQNLSQSHRSLAGFTRK